MSVKLIIQVEGQRAIELNLPAFLAAPRVVEVEVHDVQAALQGSSKWNADAACLVFGFDAAADILNARLRARAGEAANKADTDTNADESRSLSREPGSPVASARIDSSVSRSVASSQRDASVSAPPPPIAAVPESCREFVRVSAYRSQNNGCPIYTQALRDLAALDAGSHVLVEKAALDNLQAVMVEARGDAERIDAEIASLRSRAAAAEAAPLFAGKPVAAVPESCRVAIETLSDRRMWDFSTGEPAWRGVTQDGNELCTEDPLELLATAQRDLASLDAGSHVMVERAELERLEKIDKDEKLHWLKALRESDRAEVVRLEAELQDWRESADKASKEICALGEHHCTCVGPLRQRIAALEADLAKSRAQEGDDIVGFVPRPAPKPVDRGALAKAIFESSGADWRDASLDGRAAALQDADAALTELRRQGFNLPTQ